MTPYRIERVRVLDAVAIAELDDLDARTFPEDERCEKAGREWWIVRHHKAGVVGFAGAKYVDLDDVLYLCRAGVLPEHRGKGLQRRLIRRRVQHGRSIDGCRGSYTYTALHNTFSASNLIACGFRPFAPNYPWGGDRANYWWKANR